MKNRIQTNNREQETPSRRSMRTRQAVMACAASVFLAFSYTHQVAAQTLSNSNETSNTTGKSNVIPTNIKELVGKTIDYASYHNYVTIGRPNDDNTKKFLFYNVGSGKFLSVGSYWGTHATLSDVPNPFWLQRRNESIVGNQWGYVRYPEQYAPGTFNYDFFHITPMQLGSREGNNRSHATYQNIDIKNVTDNSIVRNLLPDLNIQTGQKFGIDDLGINFSTQYLEADIDLSDVQGNKNKPETILSLGKDISQWSKDVIDFHIYAYKDKGEINVRTQCLCKDYTDDNGKTTINVSEQATNNYIKLVVKDGSITINGIECLPGKKKADYVNPLASFMQLTSLQVGSSQGNTRTNATYKKVLWHKAGTVTPPAPSDEKYVVEDGYEPNGKAFGKDYNGTLNDYVITGEINLGNCTTANENILSISNTSDGRWESSTSGNANSIFFYYKKGSNTINIEGVNAQHTGASNLPSLKAYATYNTTIQVKCDKTGLYIGNQLIWGPDNEIVKNLLDANKTSIIRVGSEEGSNRSHATYNTLTVEKVAEAENESSTSAKAQSHNGIATYADETTGTEGTDNVLFENKAVNGEALTERVNDINLANGDYIEADIDLSGCKDYVENVFSIGADIADWGGNLAATSGNVHIYYLGKDDTRYKLYAVLVNKDHSDDFKRIVYVPIGEDMKLKYSSKGLVINDRDIYPDVNPMPDVSYLPGHEGDIVRFKYADKDNKIYEVDDKTHKYVIVAPGEEGYDKAHGINDTFDGYLYTTESRTDQTMPLFITSRFKQEATSNGNEGVYLSWAPFLQNNQGWGNIGIFGDRNLPSQELSTNQSINSSQWFFEPVEGKPATYRIYLKMTNEQVQERNHNVSGNYERKTIQGEHKYYLQAIANDVFGNQLENYGGGYDDQTSASASSYNGVEALTTLPTGEYDEWKLFDMDEYYQLFKAANTEMSQMLDLSFLLSDPDFTRENADLGTADSWHMDKSLNGKIRIGYDNFSKKTLTDTDYTDDQGKKGVNDQKPEEMGNSQFQVIRSRTNNHGRYMGVDINGIDKTAATPSGKFYQTVTLNYPGWYAIRCGGATTVGSKLYVKYGNDIIEHPLHNLTQKEWNFLNGTSKDMIWPYDWVEKNEVSPDAMPMYNALVTMNDPNAATDTYNQAMKDLYDKWHSQVVFFVDPDVLNAQPNKEMTVTFGIDVAPNTGGVDLLSENAGATSSSEDSETSDPLETSIQWTVFDNFHLLFGGNDGEPFLVLDEDDTTLDHLDKSIHKYRSGYVDGKEINKKLYLHRTFTADKWNTLMLPVGLTKEQFDATFGKGTPVAELSKLTDKEIQFKTVTSEQTYDKKDADGKLYDETAYWMKPMTPYIIKPSVDGGTDTEGYTAHLYTWESQGNSYLEKTVGGNGQKCFVIEHINMVEGVVKTEQAGEISTFGSKWDFAHMMTTINNKDYPYVMRGQVADQNGTMTAYGHLAKNFEKNATTGKNQLIDGRAAMDDSYTLSNNKLTYLGKGASSKAFRCWFQYTQAAETGAKPMPTLVLDGVDMTTGIDDITANDEGITLIGKYKEGIYTLGGQRLSKDSADFDRLPKGIYIVDGKKIAKE